MAWFSKLTRPKETLPQHPTRPIFLHNTLGGLQETFTPPEARAIRMYNCGPTVYGPSHIGNLRAYIFPDLLRRMLEYNNLAVKQVVNITDVGHLASDADTSEDKMTKGMLREGMEVSIANMHILAEKYAEEFIADLQKVGIDTENITFPRASAYIDSQIAIIKTLEEKGYTYQTSDGVYYDTARFPDYGKLGNIHIEGQKEGARVEANPEKRNPADFNLWKKDEKMGWKSPWGQGFPGWHIECSAMARSCLGEQLDIHTGGVDLMPTHHNNEIAQSEAATGKKPFSRFWMYNEFLNIENEKISKSIGNVITLAELPGRGFHPLALRYYYLTARYSTPLNFSWESLQAAQSALLRLHFLYNQLPEEASAAADEEYQRTFHERINEDLDTPGAIAIMWQMLKDEKMTPASLRATLTDFDQVLGLTLGKGDETLQALIRAEFGEVIENDKLPENIRAKVIERDAARIAKDWTKADVLREDIQKQGYAIEDTPAGGKILKRS